MAINISDLSILLCIIAIPFLSTIFLYLTYFICSIIPNKSNLTGKDVADAILEANDLEDIKVGKTPGLLSDYYSYGASVIMLSSGIYDKNSLAAAAVAAHECGHAIQYSVGYKPIEIRNKIVPIVNFGSNIGYIIVVIALTTKYSILFWPGLILTSLALIFQLLTLPIEFNASKRGKKQLIELELIELTEKIGVSLMLLAAALTYVSSLLVEMLQLLRYVLIFINRRDD